jgi:hypothetical protein
MSVEKTLPPNNPIASRRDAMSVAGSRFSNRCSSTRRYTVLLRCFLARSLCNDRMLLNTNQNSSPPISPVTLHRFRLSGTAQAVRSVLSLSTLFFRHSGTPFSLSGFSQQNYFGCYNRRNFSTLAISIPIVAGGKLSIIVILILVSAPTTPLTITGKDGYG